MAQDLKRKLQLQRKLGSKASGRQKLKETKSGGRKGGREAVHSQQPGRRSRSCLLGKEAGRNRLSLTTNPKLIPQQVSLITIIFFSYIKPLVQNQRLGQSGSADPKY